MDSEYSQAQLQRPVYGEEPQQGIGSATAQGGEEKTKKPVLKKVKDKVKGPVKKIKHTIGKKSKTHGDKQGDKHGDDNLASSENVESPDPEDEEGYEEDDEEQEVDPEVHGGDGGLRDTISGAREDETGKTASGLGDYKGNVHEDPAAPGSVAGNQENQPGSFPPTAGQEVDVNPSLTQSFQRMAVADRPENEKQTQQDASLTGSHDQLSAEPVRGDQQKSPRTDYPGSEARTQQQDESLPTSKDTVSAGSHDQFSSEPMQEDERKSLDSSAAGQPQDHGAGAANPSESSPNQDTKNQSYATKLTAAAAGLASTVYGTAANAGTVVKEKVTPSGQQKPSDESATDEARQKPGYTQRVYEAVQPAKERATGLASAAYEKAAGAGAAAKEKAVGAGAATKEKTAGTTEATKEKAAGATETVKEKAAGATEAAKEKAAQARGRAGETAAGAKGTFAEKTKPGDEEKALSQVISDMITTKKDTAKERTSEAADISSEKAKEGTGVAKDKANELKDKTVEAKDVGTEKAKETAAQAKEGTDNNGTPMVEKIKGAVTSLFGSRASTDAHSQAAVEQRSTQEVAEGEKVQEQSA